MSSSAGKGLAHLASFYVPAERCSRKRVCHKLLLPGAVAGELSKPKPFEMNVYRIYRSKHQVSHVRQTQKQTASVCFWPARPPQIAEGVAFSNKLCSFEFGICSQSGVCEASGIGTLARFVSKEMLFWDAVKRARVHVRGSIENNVYCRL